MYRTKQDRDYLKLTDMNSNILELVDAFKLVNEDGKPFPKVGELDRIKFSLFWQEGDNTN